MSDTPPPRHRGLIALLEQNCTSCMLCARECPDWCITVESHTETVPGPGRPRQTHVLDRFSIDFGLCLFCGICIEVCPFDALFWSPEQAPAADGAEALVHEKDLLGTWLRGVPAPPPHDPGAAPPAETEAAARRDRRGP